MKYLVIFILLNCIQLKLSNLQAGQINEYRFSSQHLSQPVSIQVSEPDDFDKSRSYTTVYVLDTKRFYRGELQQDIIQRVRQLESFELIPPVILAFIEVENWYQTLFNQGMALSQFLQVELKNELVKHYKTSDSLIFGYSYGAAYLIHQSPVLQPDFTQIIAMSAVFPDVDYIQSAQKGMQGSERRKPAIKVYQEAGHFADLNILTNVKQLEVTNIPYHSHQSVVPLATEYALLDFFSDYLPAKYLGLDLSLSELESEFKRIRTKYNLSVSEVELQQFYRAMARRHMEAGNLELGFKLWERAPEQYRHYFINQWGARFLAMGNTEAARYTWAGLGQLYPYSPYAWHHLLQLANKINDIAAAQIARQYLEKAVQSFPADDQPMYMYFIEVYGEKYPTLSHDILQRIITQTPDNVAALEQLYLLYTQTGDALRANETKLKLEEIKSAASR